MPMQNNFIDLRNLPAPSQENDLPDMAYEELEKVLKKGYRTKAEEIANAPDGLNALKDILTQWQKGKLSAESPNAVLNNLTIASPKNNNTSAENESLMPESLKTASSESEEDIFSKQALEILTRKPKTTPFGIISDILTLGTATKSMELKGKRAELENLAKAKGIVQGDLGEKASYLSATAKIMEETRRAKEAEKLAPIIDAAMRKHGYKQSIDGLTPEQTEAVSERVGFDPEIKNISPAGPTITFDTQKEIVDRSMQIAKSFTADNIVDQYRIVSTQVNQMDSLLRFAMSGDADSMVAIDQALITTFNKINDPTSVVRESEYARTSGDLKLINKIVGAIDKLFKTGGAGLTMEDREALVEGAKIIANEKGKSYNEAYDRYDSMTKKSQAYSDIVFGGMKKHKHIFLKKEAQREIERRKRGGTSVGGK